MTTHIRVSSTCTPTPLVFAFEVPRVRTAGRMNSTGVAWVRLGLYWATPFSGGDEESTAEGIVKNMPLRQRSLVELVWSEWSSVDVRC